MHSRFSSRWKSYPPIEDYSIQISRKDNLLLTKYTNQMFQHFAACCHLMLSLVHIHGIGSPQVYRLFLPSYAIFTAPPSPPLTLTYAPLWFVKTARLVLQAVPGNPCSQYSLGQFSTSVPRQELKTEMKFVLAPLPAFSKPVNSVVFSVRTLTKH